MSKEKITNEYAIRNFWTKEQIANELIYCYSKDDYDYDYDDNLYICGNYDVYVTSDGKEYEDKDDAFKHEMWWLSQESKDI